MGTLWSGDCADCGYHFTAYLGPGMRDFSSASALTAGRNDPRLAEALARGAQFQIERRITLCSNCKKLLTSAIVSCQLPGEEPITVWNTCPDCGKSLRWFSPDVKAVVCPKCGGIINFHEAGFWD